MSVEPSSDGGAVGARVEPARLIDVHHHILPPSYVAALGDRLGPQTLTGAKLHWTPEESLESMDRTGIALAVTSFAQPGFWFGDLTETLRLVRMCNDYSADMRRDHPKRFGMFGVLPMPVVESCLREIEYALDVLHADGIGLLTNYAGRYPGHSDFAPVFDELNRRGSVVFFHPTLATYGNCLNDISPATLEFPFETTRAVTSLLYSGTFLRCRNVRFLFSHAGGAVPFLAERIARLTVKAEFKKHVPDGVLPELHRLYFDTALSVNRFAFPALLQLVGATNVIFGTTFRTPASQRCGRRRTA
jgi:predicted TIM-barrel fold metal-dependent hydrolase